MIIRKTLALVVSAVTAGTVLITAPADAATQSITVDCAQSSAPSFTLASGDQIVFTLNATCQSMIQVANSNTPVTTSVVLQGFVDRMANLSGTGGSAVASVTGSGPYVMTVTYTAGPREGTDSLNVSAAGLLPRRLLLPRNGYGTNSYSMTVPGAENPGPPPQWQMIGRKAGEACPVGWGNSWAQWPNNNTGGFVCVREYYYNRATDSWLYR